MKPVEIFVRHSAEIDAHSYFDFIFQRNPEAASRFLTAIEHTVETLALHPQIGRVRKFRKRGLKNIRSWRIKGFENYLIFYRFTGARVDILHIKHGAMKFPKSLLIG